MKRKPAWVYHYKLTTLKDIAEYYESYSPCQTANLDAIEMKADFDSAARFITSTGLMCLLSTAKWLKAEKIRLLHKIQRRLNTYRFGKMP